MKRTKEFKDFIKSKYIDIVDTKEPISDEQLEIIIHVYEIGFMDALKLSPSE